MNSIYSDVLGAQLIRRNDQLESLYERVYTYILLFIDVLYIYRERGGGGGGESRSMDSMSSGILGTQLIRRNVELAALYKKACLYRRSVYCICIEDIHK